MKTSNTCRTLPFKTAYTTLFHFKLVETVSSTAMSILEIQNLNYLSGKASLALSVVGKDYQCHRYCSKLNCNQIVCACEIVLHQLIPHLFRILGTAFEHSGSPLVSLMAELPTRITYCNPFLNLVKCFCHLNPNPKPNLMGSEMKCN